MADAALKAPAADAIQAPEAKVAALRKEVDAQIGSLEDARWSWWQHWRLLCRYIQPRLGRFIANPNAGNRGSPRNQAIINNTATLSSQRFAAGMMAGTCSPARPWFKLHVGGRRFAQATPAAGAYGDECALRMNHVFAESNFYRTIATAYEEEGVIGTTAGMIYEDFEDVVRCYPGTAGEYFIGNDGRLEAGVFGRKIVKTVRELVDEFTLARCSESVQQSFKNNGLDQEIVVGHLVRRVDALTRGFFGMADKAWVEVFWEYGTGASLLRVRGFHEKPFWGARWNVTGNDAYGRSPGMDALGDTIAIQVAERRKAQAIEKLINPPMIADARLQNQPASTIPGAVTFVEPSASGIGFKSAYQINPDIAAISADIGLAERRVRATFFEDLFLGISQLDSVRSATEIIARKEEKMLMLGPPLERNHDELLGPAVERIFNIMNRAGLLPPPPDELAGMPIEVEFVSILAQAQRAVDTTAIERSFAFGGNLAAIKPEVMDNYDADEAARSYNVLLGAPSKILLSPDAVAAIRAGRAQKEQQALALQTGLAAAKGAETLSNVDVGGGQNAISLMTGLGGTESRAA